MCDVVDCTEKGTLQVAYVGGHVEMCESCFSRQASGKQVAFAI